MAYETSIKTGHRSQAAWRLVYCMDEEMSKPYNEYARGETKCAKATIAKGRQNNEQMDGYRLRGAGACRALDRVHAGDKGVWQG